MVVVLLLSVFWNLVYAVGIGLVLAALFFMKKMGDISSKDARISPVSEEKAWQDEKKLSDSFLKNVFIKHLNGPLFFGFTSEFINISKQIPQTASIVIIRMSRVPYIDQSGLFALEDVLMELNEKKILTLMVGVQSQPKYLMKSIGILGTLIPEEQTFENFDDCRKYIILKQDNISN